MVTAPSRYHLLSPAQVACFLIIASKSVVAHDGQIRPLPFDEDVSLASRKLPPTSTKKAIRTNEALTSCHAGAICAGPGKMYPIGRQPGTIVHSRFVVPDIPKQYDSTQNTYYDYLNIFWRQQPTGGYMNQFVPQLMLGNALSNSTNGPEYYPKWIKMDTWHIGAQYFMGLCVRNDTFPDGFECDKETWLAKAAVGRLVPVEPGELIETRFELDAQYVWRLYIGVIGGGPDRQSQVTSNRPFMGLVNSTRSWDEDIYDNVYVGSCLENYGMVSKANYPIEWQIDVNILSPKAGSWWRDWRLEAPNGCPWQPTSQVDNIAGERWQKAVWRAYVE